VDLPQRSGSLVVDLPQRSGLFGSGSPVEIRLFGSGAPAEIRLFGRSERKDAKTQRRKEDRKPPASPSGPLARRGFRLRTRDSPGRDSPRTGKKAKKAWESKRGIRWAAGERSSGPEENGFFCEPMVRRKSLVEERVGLATEREFG
jgi:hypothetical protein